MRAAAARAFPRLCEEGVMAFLARAASSANSRRGASSPSGHRALRSYFSPSSGSAVSGGASTPSSRSSRSAPHHATITPLSVHHRGGGATSSRSFAPQMRSMDARTDEFAATPPARTSWRGAGSPSRLHKLFAHSHARSVRSSRCFTAHRWNPAARSARTLAFSSLGAHPSPSSFSSAIRTLVFKPAKEKSHVFGPRWLRSGTGRFGNALGFPRVANFSSAAPPPPGPLASRCSSLAVFSNASPMASSRQRPKMV
mmetsp:Transcript_11744/g.31089  ORF Transcript_11744/g.31089 Transcript_11744/m.31089 type:complete len:255 (+) Transcript_11744:125-889(+)